MRLLSFLFLALHSLLLSSPVFALEASEIIKAISDLRVLSLSPEAKQNIENYLRASTNPVVQEGLERLLEKERQAEHARLRHSLRRIKIDGKASDWSLRNFEEKDDGDDWLPINPKKKMGRKRAQFDTVSYGVASDGRYLNVMLKPRIMPRSGKYYYAINILSSASRLRYTIAWSSDYGSYVSEFNEENNAYLRSFRPSGMRSAKGRIFEARVPLKALKKLPEYYHYSSIAWDEARNRYNYTWTINAQTSLPEKYRNYALELFARYAEAAPLDPETPLAAAQALADAYIYRKSEDSLRDTIVADGLLMLEEAKKTESYSFSDQEKLSKLSLDQIISWSNRASLYNINNQSWRFREILSKNGEKYNEAIYKFLFLDPAVFDDIRALLAAHDMIVPGSLPETMWKIEESVVNHQRYRASLDFLESLVELIGTEYWQRIYEEAKFEEDNHLDVITEIEGVPIYKRNNYSASSQLRYFSQNGDHFGNCGDVAVMSLAIAKALGIASMHIHYDLIDDEFYRVVHSFPAYYSSAEGRYIGFRRGYNRAWDYAKSGRERLRVHYYYDLPIFEWLAQFNYTPLPGTIIWTASNEKTAIVSLEEWESFNTGGFSAP